MNPKNNKPSQFQPTGSTTMQMLMVPVSIVLAAVIIMVAILISATAILDRDQIVTKSTLKQTLADALKEANVTAGTGTTPTPAVTVSLDQVKGLVKEGNIVFGKADSKVIFVEFSDPSCPYCHVAGGKDAELNKQMGDQFKLVADGGTYVAPVVEMKKLVDEGKAAFVWLYSNGHGNGEVGTQALYCSYEKGKFWEVHDLLMNQKGYDLLNTTVKNDVAQSDKVAEFTKDVIDPTFMRDCIKSGKYAQRVAADNQLSSQFGIGGTPGFFINSQSFAGAYSYTEMKSTVDQALSS